MSPPVVWIADDRGRVEAPTTIKARAAVDGVLADLVDQQ
jgi:hypothetical protein